MAEEQINDFLLDQELDPDDLAGDNELPDDIDAILDAVEGEDITTMPRAQSAEPEFDDNSKHDVLDDPISVETEEFVTDDDLEKELNIAAEPSTMSLGSDSIPLLGEVIDPNNPPQAAGASAVMTLSEEMMDDIMAQIQTVVEQSVSEQIGKLADTVRDSVVKDVQNKLPGVLNRVLKGK